MNKLIFRKLSFDIFSFFLLSSVAITSIVWVIQGVNLLDIVSEQGHGLKVYFFYTTLNLPKIFSKLLIFTYFLTLFVVLARYEENNEILVFWTNGIKKISFINFIGKLSLIFVLIQLFAIALGILSPTIHAVRLHFVEWMGKFYDGSGRAFKPLGGRPLYVEGKS